MNDNARATGPVVKEGDGGSCTVAMGGCCERAWWLLSSKASLLACLEEERRGSRERFEEDSQDSARLANAWSVGNERAQKTTSAGTKLYGGQSASPSHARYCTCLQSQNNGQTH